MNVTTDRHGKRVKEGDRVRVLSIDPSLVDSLEPEEKPRVKSMVGDTLIVDEVNDYGYALVEKWWHTGPESSVSHTVACSSNEIELIESVP